MPVSNANLDDPGDPVVTGRDDQPGGLGREDTPRSTSAPGGDAAGSEIDGIRRLLRAFAEVRNGPFYLLWLDAQRRVKQPMPRLGPEITGFADGINVALSVGVSFMRADGVEISWGVGLDTSGEALNVSGTIERDDDQGIREVFECSQTTASPREAAELAHRFAREVCAQRQWLDVPGAAGIPGSEGRPGISSSEA